MADTDSIPIKRCARCKVEKPRSEFPWHTKSLGILRADCTDCRHKVQAAYHCANRDKINAARTAKRPAGSEIRNAKNREWYFANHDREKAKRDAWRAANPLKMRLAATAWRAKYPERQKAAEDAYRAANPEIDRIKAANRRARINASGGVLSKDIAVKLYRIQKGRCACCGESLASGYHLDHAVPLALGGANEDANMQLLTPKCNLRKGAKHPVVFMQERGFLL